MTTNEVPISDDASDFQHSKKKTFNFSKKIKITKAKNEHVEEEEEESWVYLST